MQNDLYSSSTSWDWQKVSYEIGETQSQLRNNEPGFQKFFFVSHRPSWGPIVGLSNNTNYDFLGNLAKKISTLNIFFEFRRFKPFVDLTLYTPIYVLLILLPLGVLIPGNCPTPYRSADGPSMVRPENLGPR